uniref:Uncharacterized protein n=1 Tax=Anguilla anguilla TaxID=7936 RepID=A0A0E9SI52_ANGAN
MHSICSHIIMSSAILSVEYCNSEK